MTITKSLKAKEINKVWYVADAEGKTLGRFASEIAKVLRGKHKPTFTPNLDMGDFVVVVNAEKVNLSGKKNTDKTYFKHTGYIGSKTFTKLDQIRKIHPERKIQIKHILNILAILVQKHLPSLIKFEKYTRKEL